MRGSKRESSEELELDLIEVLEEDEVDKEGGEKLSRTESSKSFESLGEEVFSNMSGKFFTLFIFYIYLDGTRTVGSEEE